MHEPYTVVVVEDEITAMKNICTIIAQKCPLFKVVGQCENGLLGLLMIRELKPDLAITDIKMPVMNGLDLLETVSKEFPFLSTIVISGYHNFEYVKGALTTGSLDYLLKPVTPAKLQAVLKQVAGKISDIRLEQRIELVKGLLAGTDVQKWKLQKYFPDNCYYAGIVRINSLPRRFHRSYGLEISSCEENMMAFYGRDEMEKLYLCSGKKVISLTKFKAMISDIARKNIYKEPEYEYTTAVVFNETFPIAGFSDCISSLYRTLDSNLIIGCSQIFCDERKAEIDLSSMVIDQDLFTRVEYFLNKNKFDDFRYEIRTLIDKWKKEGRTQQYVENVIQRIYHYLIKCSKKSPDVDMYELMLDDTFYYASSYRELKKSILDIFHQIIKEDYGTFSKVDTLEFFTMVNEYIDIHFSEQLSLQGICDVFGISQTYMSKLFRKYTEHSFTGYVKHVRVEKAKKLMNEQRSLRIKDIAAMVGFKDQFYFSRVFHLLAGVTPSEFTAQNI